MKIPINIKGCKRASNLYFPILRSSIWIPENDGFPEELKDIYLTQFKTTLDANGISKEMKKNLLKFLFLMIKH